MGKIQELQDEEDVEMVKKYRDYIPSSSLMLRKPLKILLTRLIGSPVC